MAVTKLCTYIETLFTDVGYIFTNVSNGCDKNWIRELIKMSQTLLMFSLMLQPLLIQYVSNGCDKIAVRRNRTLREKRGKAEIELREMFIEAKPRWNLRHCVKFTQAKPSKRLGKICKFHEKMSHSLWKLIVVHFR